jgi:nicotinamidase-related amidase
LFLEPTAVSRPVFLCCDVQTRFSGVLPNLHRAAFISRRFAQYCTLWNAHAAAAASSSSSSPLPQLRFIATEQYPKGLGRLHPACGHRGGDASDVPVGADTSAVDAALQQPLLPFVSLFEKTCFSMLSDEVAAELAATGSRRFVLFGVEAHACVLQTARDILAAHPENQVFIAADGTYSQREEDRSHAFATLRAAGACVSTSESLLLQLTNDAAHPTFRGVSGLLKQQIPAEKI